MSSHGGNYGHSNAFVHSGNFAHNNWNAWGHNWANLLTLSGGRVPDSVARQLKKIPEPRGTIQLK
jgi:hypothetical protein